MGCDCNINCIWFLSNIFYLTQEAIPYNLKSYSFLLPKYCRNPYGSEIRFTVWRHGESLDFSVSNMCDFLTLSNLFESRQYLRHHLIHVVIFVEPNVQRNRCFSLLMPVAETFYIVLHFQVVSPGSMDLLQLSETHKQRLFLNEPARSDI
jgi:hypothetical protein